MECIIAVLTKNNDLASLCAVCCKDLAESLSPVERDIARLLVDGAVEGAAAVRLQRYHRKIDVARRVMAAYDDRIDQAIGNETVSSQGYIGLACLFADVAKREVGQSERSRANMLRWVNSAFSCLDQLAPSEQRRVDLDSVLQVLLRKAFPS